VIAVIKVKKPFEPDNTQSNEAKPLAEVVSTYMEVHPEHEEKPLAPHTTSTSEDHHGGEELTFSLPSQFSSSQPASEQSSSQPSTQPSSSQSSLEEHPEQDSTTVQENARSIKASTSDGESERSSTQRGQSEWSTESLQEPENPAESPESNTNNDGQDSGRVKEENSKETGPNSETEKTDENTGVGVTDTEDTETGVEEEDQTPSHVYNTQQAFDIIPNTDFNVKYYQTEFYRFLEMVAEEKTKVYDPVNAEEYNVKKLMFRPYEKKPLNYYKMSRVRDTVVLILDNSGSMAWWSRNIQILAGLAMERNDVELYIAPNGYIKQAVHRGQFISVSHSEVVKRLQGRKIIYVGDFDGANTAIELSWYNDVIWVCPESRYKHFLQHDWVHYDESQFKGAFVRVFTLEEIFGVFKRVLSNPRVWIDLCGEKYECGVYS
jgi:hypothetical protein